MTMKNSSKQKMELAKHRRSDEDPMDLDVSDNEENDSDLSTVTSSPIPDKSMSLRARSVRKRLQTELKIKSPKVKEPSSNSSRAARMTKYRRKTANAKERERMKAVNQAFDRLRDVMPDLSLILEEEKETKVTTLRAAIQYIYGLQKLLEDINAGNIDPEEYKRKENELKPREKKPLVGKGGHNRANRVPRIPKFPAHGGSRSQPSTARRKPPRGQSKAGSSSTSSSASDRLKANSGGGPTGQLIKCSPVTLSTKGHIKQSADKTALSINGGVNGSFVLSLQPRGPGLSYAQDAGGNPGLGAATINNNGGPLVGQQHLVTLSQPCTSGLEAASGQAAVLVAGSDPTKPVLNLLCLRPVPISDLFPSSGSVSGNLVTVATTAPASGQLIPNASSGNVVSLHVDHAGNSSSSSAGSAVQILPCGQTIQCCPPEASAVITSASSAGCCSNLNSSATVCPNGGQTCSKVIVCGSNGLPSFGGGTSIDSCSQLGSFSTAIYTPMTTTMSSSSVSCSSYQLVDNSLVRHLGHDFVQELRPGEPKHPMGVDDATSGMLTDKEFYGSPERNAESVVLMLDNSSVADIYEVVANPSAIHVSTPSSLSDSLSTYSCSTPNDNSSLMMMNSRTRTDSSSGHYSLSASDTSLDSLMEEDCARIQFGGDSPEQDMEEDVDNAEDSPDGQDSIPTSPTKLIPTIDQLFKRSFSKELEELAKACQLGPQQKILEDLDGSGSHLTDITGEQGLCLDDLHQIIEETEGESFSICT